MLTTQHILVFGAGKSATVLIDYLKQKTTAHQWKLTVADSDLQTVEDKLGTADGCKAVQLNILDAGKRASLIQDADVVISLMPPSLHLPIAEDCLAYGKHLLTASYADPAIKALASEVRNKDILFLCEMGLDPGIDHMSAMQLIHRIQAEGGDITSLYSHCGGLVAPESDNNPWHYKISWNPRNVVLAGKAGAIYRENGTEKKLSYADLFRQHTSVSIPSLGTLSYYANRDSLAYIDLYALPEVKNFLRTTLRHPDFCKGWAAIVALQLTDESLWYDTDGLPIQDFLKQHLAQNKLQECFDAYMNDPLLNEQFSFLGFFSEKPINKGKCSAADILQWRMEESWLLHPTDKDMIVMLHEITYLLDGKSRTVKSSLVVKGENHLRTAMAKTVGLPLAIAAVLIADGSLKERGLHIPVTPAIYEPVLTVLKQEGILFQEQQILNS
ncbi:saccharopine dehydrogenase C-terminal domain-containing protein [Sediminibacterium goheungense]|uniref:Saccharopine dehydrogenase-like NADP-dependent oxidoreductase n=1 Tax=Sediminibacterium goheungense TaxID=1086393 RepID=A0A4R6IRR6_9BACT|nr:saccharopine dehydrogenase C-terminal domain-containing protein [Sediminibacterium goheungense]TDO25152.1 saccharopine dehydrogenase-like NADP-dependent oxidoreductase [Sediminibacterium goheungense]